MKNRIERFTVLTRHEVELTDITGEVLACVESSGVRSGVVYVLSLHTTTALTVNEGLPDLEADIEELIRGLVPDPEDRPYRHARFLHGDGQMAINAPSHLRGALLGFQVFFPVEEGRVVKGARQTIYFVELDGPQERTYVVQVLGE
jgi:secondary thiamine-phosphate synthase enzyme